MVNSVTILIVFMCEPRTHVVSAVSFTCKWKPMYLTRFVMNLFKNRKDIFPYAFFNIEVTQLLQTRSTGRQGHIQLSRKHCCWLPGNTKRQYISSQGTGLFCQAYNFSTKIVICVYFNILITSQYINASQNKCTLSVLRRVLMWLSCVRFFTKIMHVDSLTVGQSHVCPNARGLIPGDVD